MTLLGVPLSVTDADGACRTIVGRSRAGVGGWVITPNLDILRRLVKDPEFRTLCERTDLRLADGMPLVWASRVRGTPLPERVAGSDLIWRLAQHAGAADRSVFLLGGNPGSAENAASVLRERTPNLRVAGTACPPIGFENDPAYMAQLEQQIAAASPDIVFVGLGSPKQEILIARLREVFPRAWYLGVGVTFSFTAGDIHRAPAWMRRAGLEWCHRLAMEPGRLWKRYLVHGVPFGIRLMCSATLDRLRGASHTGKSNQP
jgi:N-acetylglucosaminyldiphosphoundecaprenol N-acetyl-beta-D-mannosaminyltransferase